MRGRGGPSERSQSHMNASPPTLAGRLTRLAAVFASSCAVLFAISSRAAAPAVPAAPAAAGKPPAPIPSTPAIASWSKVDGGVEFALADGAKAKLLVRAPYSVRLT